MRPIVNICQGVHGPCPKKMFDTSMASAPVMNPSSRPKHNPVMMMSAVTGLMAGTGAKIKRPATVNAVMTMIGMMSRARRRSASKSVCASSLPR